MKNAERSTRQPIRDAAMAVAAGAAVFAALHVGIAPLQAEPASGRHSVLDEITVKRINVVAEDGVS